jgi:hypothetical protein
MTCPTPLPTSQAARVPRFVLALLVALLHSPAAGVSAQVATYEYVYPYNTPDLTENHYLVLDTSGPEPRAWYYGTSDEFDTAREGYLPGFFVAPTTDLALSAAAISFAIDRPDRFFAAPVPLDYRSPDDVPAGLLGEWSVPLPTAARRYAGTLSDDTITLDVPGGPRVFQRMREP